MAAIKMCPLKASVLEKEHLIQGPIARGGKMVNFIVFFLQEMICVLGEKHHLPAMG
jgi:hypothetical protein